MGGLRNFSTKSLAVGWTNFRYCFTKVPFVFVDKLRKIMFLLKQPATPPSLKFEFPTPEVVLNEYCNFPFPAVGREFSTDFKEELSKLHPRSGVDRCLWVISRGPIRPITILKLRSFKGNRYCQLTFGSTTGVPQYWGRSALRALRRRCGAARRSSCAQPVHRDHRCQSQCSICCYPAPHASLGQILR